MILLILEVFQVLITSYFAKAKELTAQGYVIINIARGSPKTKITNLTILRALLSQHPPLYHMSQGYMNSLRSPLTSYVPDGSAERFSK